MNDDITIIELPIGPEEIKHIEKIHKDFTTTLKDKHCNAKKYNSNDLIAVAEIQRRIFWRLANIIGEKKEGA